MKSTDCDETIEQILHSVGDNGRYQWYLLWIFFVPLSTLSPFTILVQIFQTSIPDHWCHVPGRPEAIPIEQWKNMTIPWTEKEGKKVLSKCQQFTTLHLKNIRNESFETKACENGWDYDHTWYDRTLPVDMNWVCEKDSYSARWLTAGLVGKVMGSFIFSSLSDQYGRKVGTILSSQFYSVFAIARLFVTTEWAQMTLMFLSSMAFPAVIEIPWIFVVEQVPKESRSMAATVSFCMWTVGACLIPLLAWWTRDWIILGIVTSVVFVPFLLLWWFFPESPRWLLSRGRVKESVKAFQRIAKINGKVCPHDMEEKLQKLVGKKIESKSWKNRVATFRFFGLLKHPLVRKRTLLLTVCLICNVLLYYGIIYNTSNISGNEFLNFFYLTISELPGSLVGWFCADKLGRRVSSFGFFLLASIAAFITIFVSFLDSWLEVFFLVICKGFGNVCFLILYIQMPEIQPTSHRASGSAFASIVSSIFAIVVPYISYSASFWPAMPYVMLTLVGLAGSFNALFLPETLGVNLPQTISDASNLLPDQSFWYYGGWRPGKKKDSTVEEDEGNINYAMSSNNLS